jgi:tartrate dehydratase alpha subunit/fumarate hydratase class I-like protein
MMRLKVQDRVIEVGGTADFAKSVILVRASSEDEIRQLIAEDVYTTGGVWGKPVTVGYGRLVLGE